jgi:hypothetical protein
MESCKTSDFRRFAREEQLSGHLGISKTIGFVEKIPGLTDMPFYETQRCSTAFIRACN